MELDQASVKAAGLEARAAAIREEASATMAHSDERLSKLPAFISSSEKETESIIRRANSEAMETLEAALELSESLSFEQDLGIEAIEGWVSEKATKLANAMIGDFESMVVDIGFRGGLNRDDLSPEIHDAA